MALGSNKKAGELVVVSGELVVLSGERATMTIPHLFMSTTQEMYDSFSWETTLFLDLTFSFIQQKHVTGIRFLLDA